MPKHSKQAAKDFATGKNVAIQKPEEQVRQEFERILHNDLGYPLDCLDIEVAVPMGSAVKRCDIAVYESAEKRNIVGIVEIKAPGQAFQRGQLQSYMSATPCCVWGVWTNRDETHCARRESDGRIVFDSAFSPPRFGERGVRIRSFDDLRPPSNLKWVFRQINNRLYANTNLPRTEKQGAEMVRLIFCKLTDEYETRENGRAPRFQIMDNESPAQMRKRINALWQDTLDGRIGAPIFERGEKIKIDDYSLRLIVGMLQMYSLLNTNRDVVGDAFEVFAERQFAGEKGQFFTPRAVVQMIVDMICPKKTETILDPACGSGGFLVSVLNYVAGGHGADEKRQIAEHCLYGIDKDGDLSKICKAQMSILGDGKSNIVTADSLKPSAEWNDFAKSKLLDEDGALKQFDAVITNPPFGSTIKVEHEHVLQQYDLGHEWKWNREEERWCMDKKRTKKTPPQVLFIELCIRFLKDGGRMGIVLPDGLLGNPGDGYIRQWLEIKAEILAVVDCPIQTFMPHTGTKTSVLILRKRAAGSSSRAPFMAVAEHCGHTNRGRPVYVKKRLKEDFSQIRENFLSDKARGHLGFRPRVLRDGILVPRYYDPRILRDIRRLEKEGTAEMVSIVELEVRGLLAVSGVPASAQSEDYDLHGEIRFVRTSDISGHEIYARTQKNVSEETYWRHRDRQDLQIGDILFVKDGDDKIGETAILADDDDLKILVQTHFKKLRARAGLDPYLLLYLLSMPIVKRQIRQRVFSQSTLSTIGKRIGELRLPLPADHSQRTEIARNMRDLVLSRRESLRRIRELAEQ